MTPLDVAKKYIGLKEQGTNRGPEIDRWLKNTGVAVGNPWCAAFASSMWIEAGIKFPVKSASSQAFRRWAEKEGLFFTDPQKLLECESAIFGWTNSDKVHGHVGFVAKRYTTGGKVVAIGTIEGNADGGGSRLGDGVYELKRKLPGNLWFVDTSKWAKWWPKSTQMPQELSDLERCYAFTAKAEGGYTEDQGGRTNRGVTEKVYKAWRKEKGLPEKDILEITKEEARQIFKDRYWVPSRAAELPWPLSLAVVDLAFNAGTGRSTELLQLVAGVEPDMQFGPKTMAAVKALDPKLAAVRLTDMRQGYCVGLVVANPDKHAQSKHGWRNRCIALRKEIG